MRILFMMPSLPPGKRILGEMHIRYFPPLGIGYLASILEKEGHEVVILDQYRRTWEETIAKLEGERFDLLGVTVLSPSREAAHRLVRWYAKRFPGVPILMGGPYATYFAEMLVGELPVDAVVVGEAESTIVELVEALCSKSSLAEIKGIVWKDKSTGQVVRNAPRPLIRDLDSLPFPAHHLFHYKEYDRFWPGNTQLLRQFTRNFLRGKRWAPILTTRGCDFACEFCAVRVTMPGRSRSRSAGNVIEEVELLHRAFGFNHIFLQDAMFPIASDLTRGMCDQLLSKGMKMTFAANVRADMATLEDLRLMKRAGFYYLLFGVESANPDILKTITKEENLEQIEQAIAWCREVGFLVGLHFIVGFEEETEETVRRNVEMIRRIKPDTCYIRPLAIYPGTTLYDKVISRGIMSPKEWLAPGPFFHYYYEHTAEQIMRWREVVKLNINKDFQAQHPIETIKQLVNRRKDGE